MKDAVGSIYRAALEAIDECVAKPALRQWLAKIAAQSAADAGTLVSESFVDTAVALPQELQGDVLWKINKILEDPRLREGVADILVQKLRGPVQDACASAASEFTRDGIAMLDGLVAAPEANEMMEYLRGCQDTLRQGTLTHHHIREVVKMPYAMRIATDERVLQLAHHHLGAAPILAQMDAWWSLPNGSQPEGPQIFHRDRDDFRACKLFVYLSDVGPTNGPHVFVRGSHRLGSVAAMLAPLRLTPAQMGALFTGNGRQVSAAIEGIFGAAVSEITGSAGTSFLESTYGFHRGKVPESGKRCLFQVLYTLVPYPERLKHWEDSEIRELPAECSRSALARHATRFMAH